LEFTLQAPRARSLSGSMLAIYGIGHVNSLGMSVQFCRSVDSPRPAKLVLKSIGAQHQSAAARELRVTKSCGATPLEDTPMTMRAKRTLIRRRHNVPGSAASDHF
jgi:hypothetical protein